MAEAIWNGTEYTQVQAAERGLVLLRPYVLPTPLIEILSTGSGSLLTPEWVLTAAHVVVDKADDDWSYRDPSVLPVAHIPMTLGVPVPNPRFPPASAVAYADRIIVHPRYRIQRKPLEFNLDIEWDIALLHVASPLPGTIAPRFQPISAVKASDSQVVMRCRGYGKPAPSLPPDGIARFADFWMDAEQFSGLLTSYRGGGSFPDEFTPPTLVLEGDSGGGCILPNTEPEEDATIMAMNVARGSDYEQGLHIPAEHLRDFAYAHMYPDIPSVRLDLDGDGGEDEIRILRESGDALRLSVDFTTIGSVLFPPPPLPGVPDPLHLATALASSADFNADGRPDVFALVAGEAAYLDSGLTSGGAPALVPGFAVDDPDQRAHFSTGDFDSDGYDDVELLRSDGSWDVLYGGEQGLGGPGGGAPRGPDLDGDGNEDFGAAAVNPVRGVSGRLVVYDSNDGFGLAAEDPDGDDRPVNWGEALAWGNLDGTPGDELLVAAPGHLVELIRQQPGTNVLTSRGFGAPAGSHMGVSLAAGDFNGDGIDDVAFGASSDFDFGPATYPDGAVLVIHGDPTIMQDPSYWSPSSVLGAGDLGIAGSTREICPLGEGTDWCAFTPLVRTPRDLPRRLRISCGPLLEYLSTLRCGPRKSFVGPEALLASSRQLSRRATRGVNAYTDCTTLSGAAFGYSAVAGDFDCDGYEDLAVGAPAATVGSTLAAGAVGVVYGGPDGLDASRHQVFTRESVAFGEVARSTDAFGQELAAGNFDGDSFQGRPCIDLAIASPQIDVGHPGAVYVLHGGPRGVVEEGLSTSEAPPPPAGVVLRMGEAGVPAATAPGPLGLLFGSSVAITRADGDRYDDLVIGAPGDDDAKGALVVVPGGAAGVDPAAAAKFTRPGGVGSGGWITEGDWYGVSVSATANGVVMGGAFADVTPRPTIPPGDPPPDPVEDAGLVHMFELNATLPLQAGNLFRISTEEAGADIQTGEPWELRANARHGVTLLRPRPAFVRARERPARFDLSLLPASDTGVILPWTPPECGAAVAAPGALWPPLFQFEQVEVRVPHPAWLPVSVEILGVRQDERRGLLPDARLRGGGLVDLRAERRFFLDGRVYHVRYRATSNNGATCEGVVRVCVPVHAGGTCLDGGPRWESTR